MFFIFKDDMVWSPYKKCHVRYDMKNLNLSLLGIDNSGKIFLNNVDCQEMIKLQWYYNESYLH